MGLNWLRTGSIGSLQTGDKTSGYITAGSNGGGTFKFIIEQWFKGYFLSIIW
jgi:hypothetical protein